MHPFKPRPFSHAIAVLVLSAVLAGCAAPTARAPGDGGAVGSAPPTPASSTTPAGTVPEASSAGDAAHQQAFLAWVAAFRESARAAGIRDATLGQVLDGVRFLPRVIELDRAQPEFTRTVWDYLDRTVTAQRVTQGRAMLQRATREASGVFRSQPVPPEVVVAIWGMESNYGSNIGDTSTIDALATLGFEGRRASWAKGELLSALRIIDRGDITRERMIGSWAGAMGQTQFLPSSFLAHAVDGDGDGGRDIWDSLPDVMASTANYLASAGWQAQQPWGAEVRLPAGFDPGRADTAIMQSSAQWAAEGVASIDGASLPVISDASVLLPAGARGPAFLVGPNFRAILRYNNSTSYALAVGLLSQQIAGGMAVQSPWPRDLAALSRSETVELQTALARRGFTSGEPDGIVGPATRAAVRAYQRSVGLPADGFPSSDVLQRLRQP
jgi:lytic murein transglycosylase